MLLEAIAKFIEVVGCIVMWAGSLYGVIIGAVHYSKTGNDNMLIISCLWVAFVMYITGFFKDDQDEEHFE